MDDDCLAGLSPSSELEVSSPEDKKALDLTFCCCFFVNFSSFCFFCFFSPRDSLVLRDLYMSKKKM